jgi:HAD superfamily hydrolase (TIGR01549 family)
MQPPPWDRIQAVIFDVDGTLYDQRLLRRKIAVRMLAKCLAKPTSGIQDIRNIMAYRQALEALRGSPYSAEIHLELAARKSGAKPAQLRVSVEQWMEKAPIALLYGCRYRAVANLLETLKTQGISCGAFSEYPAEEKLVALGIRQFFSVINCAQDCGRLKPDPNGLLETLRGMGASHCNVLCVGDRAFDIEAAGRAGMHAFLISGDSCFKTIQEAFSRRQSLTLSRAHQTDRS